MYQLQRLLISLLFGLLFVGCNKEISESPDLKVSICDGITLQYEIKSFELGSNNGSPYIMIIECEYNALGHPISEKLYDDVRGDALHEFLLTEKRFEYDAQNRLSSEDTMHFKLGEEKFDYEVKQRRFSWSNNLLEVSLHDYLQGDPTRDYLVGKEIIAF